MIGLPPKTTKRAQCFIHDGLFSMRLLFKPTIHLKIAVSTAAPIFCLFSLLGCQKSDSTDHKSAESPAKVAKPVSEAQLNTIELTEAAVKRVGIQTEIASEQEAIHTRPYGADLLLPTDASVTVSAPLPGTVTGGELPDFPRVGRRVPKGQSLMKLLPLLSPFNNPKAKSTPPRLLWNERNGC